MGNQPNICCDNGRQEVSWFDQEVPAKVKIVKSRNDFTQSSIAHRGSQREKIFRSDDEDSMIYSMFGKEKGRTGQQRAKIFKETPVDQHSERSENDRQVEPVPKKKGKKPEEPVYDFQFVVNYRY